MHACMCAQSGGGQRVTSNAGPQVPPTLLETESLTSLELRQIDHSGSQAWMSWPASALPQPMAGAVGARLHAWPFPWLLRGPEFKSSHLEGQHFINEPISPALLAIIFNVAEATCL